MGVYDPAEVFHRTRRNLLIACTIIFIIGWGKVPLDQISIAGNKLIFGNPTALHWLPFIFLVYFSIRFWQSFSAYASEKHKELLQQEIPKIIEKVILDNYSKHEILSQVIDGTYKSPKVEIAKSKIYESTPGMWEARVDLNLGYTKIESGTPSLAHMPGIHYETSFYGQELSKIENKARRRLYFFGITWTEFFLPTIFAIIAMFMSVNIADRLN